MKKAKMMSKCEKCLAMTDADFPVAASVYVWVGEVNELLIEYSYADDDNPARNFAKRAVVDAEDVRALSRRLGVKPEHLPDRLDEACGVAYDTTPSEVERVFQEALEWLIEAGVQYRFMEII